LDRVQLVAILLAVGILVYWFTTVPRRPAQQAPSVTRQSESLSPPPAAGTPAIAPAPEEEPPPAPEARYDLTQGETTTLENDALRLEVSHQGGRLRSAQLKRYRAALDEAAGPVELVTAPERGTLLMFLGEGVFAGLERAAHESVRSGPRELELRTARDGIEVRRVLTLDEVGYGARLRVRVENRSSGRVHPAFQLVWYGQERKADKADGFQRYSLVASADAELVRSSLQSTNPMACAAGGGQPKAREVAAPVEWAGLDSQYFLAVAIPENPREASAYQGPIGRRAGQTVLSYSPFEVPAGGYVERNYRLYLGPKVRAEVAAVEPRLEPVVRVGWAWVRPLVELFVDMLSWTHRYVVANYGIAIILLTFLVRLVTFPLTQRSMTSMQSVSVVAPEMKQLQEKHKDDKVKLQQEMMALYRRKGINPVTAMGGGCLLMLIQMPFLLALYFALQSSIELRHAPFMLWIQDLSAPEDFLAIAGFPIRPLPLLMGVSMVLQQRLMPTPNVDPQQRQMMMWMSVFFIFLFYSFASQAAKAAKD
jgi:YidC/Oxa1 family membrane protein insertase